MTQEFLDQLLEILGDTRNLLSFAYDNIDPEDSQEDLDEISDRLEDFEALLKAEVQK